MSDPSRAAARRELDALRRRAYGPDADIASDPAALARLRLLEQAARPAPSVPVPDAQGEDESPAAVAESAPSARADAPPEEGSASRARPRRVSAAIVVGSALATGIVALTAGSAGWAGGFLAGWAGAAGPVGEAELVVVVEGGRASTPLAERTEATGGGMPDGTLYDLPVTGLSVEVFPAGGSRADDDQGGIVCFQPAVLSGDDEEPSVLAGGCGSSRLPASHDLLVVDPDDPGADDFWMGVATTEFPAGTVLRLEYDGRTEALSVWALPPDDGGSDG
ncbi:hypothetical protein [Microbacterium sp. gxy059]|uniref:hypothetical protein n=1 Tax=Microbacterium sp. gxy059 TaxID=2957199 RepID=UPI003D95A44C